MSWRDALRSGFREFRGLSWGRFIYKAKHLIRQHRIIHVPQPRKPLTSNPSIHLIYCRISLKIGRKQKAHRQQAHQEKAWRNAEKGRGKGKRGKMGQEESTIVDPSTPPQTLKARTLEALAEYIKDGRAKSIVVMVSRVHVTCFWCVLTCHRQAPV